MNAEAPEPVQTELLFKEHAGFVARFLYRLGAAHGAIDDLVQEVFLLVHRAGGYRPGPAAPATYLAGLASGVLANHRRKERTRALTLRKLSLTRGPEHQTITPAHVLEANETQRVLARALDALSPTERTILVMADLELCPCPEIASVLCLPLGTVYWHLHRARGRWTRAIERTQHVMHRPRPASERTP